MDAKGKLNLRGYNSFRWKQLGANYTRQQDHKCFAEFINLKMKERELNGYSKK